MLQFPDYKYYGYKSKFTDIAKILTIDEIQTIKKTLGKTCTDKEEHYCTIYRYNQAVKDYGRIKDFPPEITFYADYLVIDIDCDIPDEAKSAMEKFTAYLNTKAIGHEVWFSGNKGYHVLIPSVQFGFEPTNDANTLRNMALVLSEEAGIMVDEKIYNSTRIFRMPYTINLKSMKYKVPLAEVYPEPEAYYINSHLDNLYRKVIKAIKEVKEKPIFNGKVFTSTKAGNRNNKLFLMSKYFRERKVCIEDMFVIADLWNTKYCEPSLSEIEIKTTVNSAYSGAVNYITEDNLEHACYSVDRSLDRILKIYKDFDKKTLKTGYKFFDEYTMGILPGDLIFWMAVNGNFKTCMLSNLLWSASKLNKKHYLYFSLDMTHDSLCMRHMQAAENVSLKSVYKGISEGNDFSKFKEEFKNVRIFDQKTPSIDDVIRKINWFKAEMGDIALIGLDYLGAFKGCDNDPKATSDTVHGISHIAADVAGCPVICLVQARREYEGAGGNIELDKTAGKDSSVIEQKANFLIGHWWHEDERGRNYYGRFLKDRQFDSEKFVKDAYFTIDLLPNYMKVRDLNYAPQVPKFFKKQKVTY